MKRRTSQQDPARRREVVSLTHKSWTQAAIASHRKRPQGTVSRWMRKPGKRVSLIHIPLPSRAREEAVVDFRFLTGAARWTVFCRISYVARSQSPFFNGLPRIIHARHGRDDAHQGPLCAYARITVESCVSHSCVRTFSDFPMTASVLMEFENQA